MKMLFISNFYPPCQWGGYETLCHEVATHLIKRGHRVIVLTSTFGITERLKELDVHRELKLERNIHPYRPKQVLRYLFDRQINLWAIKRIIAETAPDVVVVWGMYKLSRLIAVWVEKFVGPKIVYYLSDQWPMEYSAPKPYWEIPVDSLIGKISKWLLQNVVPLVLDTDWNRPSLRFKNVIVCSKALRDQLFQGGVSVNHGKVIYHGIDPIPYQQAAKRRHGNCIKTKKSNMLHTVFVGTLMEHKGVHTVIEAIGYLVEKNAPIPVSLCILGGGTAEYEERLHQLVRKWQLADLVKFHRPIPRSELPEFLSQFDSLVLPSVYEEPMARISQEAMASHLVLVATLTGGTKEILVDGENGLAFKSEDAISLGIQLQCLAQDQNLRQRLVRNGWQTVSNRFTISRMVDEIETYLAEVTTGRCLQPPNVDD